MDQLSINFHAEYMDVVQHWSPSSAIYAGGDALITFLFEGWEMGSEVRIETKWFGGMRQCMIYHITLYRGNDTLLMPVINNPYVDRLILESELRVKEPLDENNYSDN